MSGDEVSIARKKLRAFVVRIGGYRKAAETTELARSTLLELAIGKNRNPRLEDILALRHTAGIELEDWVSVDDT